MNKQTCGPLYRCQFDFYVGKDPEKIRPFAAGFVSGQAEKVYLGACGAAMFRPSEEHYELVAEIVEQAASTYALRYCGIDKELWLYHPSLLFQMDLLNQTPRNTRQWHFIRGVLTGVPVNQLDLVFHQRRGFGEPCDTVDL